MMKQTELIMGMPVAVEIVDSNDSSLLDEIFDYFKYVDDKYSTYKPGSEISRINRGLPQDSWSEEMCQVMELCEQTKRQTGGYFDIERGGNLDPSGLVKGWSIRNAANILKQKGIENFYIDAGGDIQASGLNEDGIPWKVGIRNPFDRKEIIKVVNVNTQAVATSGTAVRGQHIYDPVSGREKIEDIVSLTVIGPDIYNTDRFATAAFAMGGKGIGFIESLPGFEAYMVGADKIAKMTSGFERYADA